MYCPETSPVSCYSLALNSVFYLFSLSLQLHIVTECCVGDQYTRNHQANTIVVWMRKLGSRDVKLLCVVFRSQQNFFHLFFDLIFKLLRPTMVQINLLILTDIISQKLALLKGIFNVLGLFVCLFVCVFCVLI